MAQPLKLNAERAAAMVANAELGLPIGRAAALAGVHRCTAMRWLSQGAAEIAEAGDDDDDDGGELGLRAQFSIDFEAARAAYLLGLATKWQERIDKQDYNTAKAIQVMMASQSPDEYSERRATRTVDQKTTLAGEIGVTRYGSMTDVELDAERQRIQARRDAAEAQDGDDWRAAAVNPPGPAGGEIDPGPGPGKNVPTAGKPDSGSITCKPASGALPARVDGSPQNIPPTRARASFADQDDPDVSLP